MLSVIQITLNYYQEEHEAFCVNNTGDISQFYSNTKKFVFNIFSPGQ
jgi:hypothetical protein